jgi:hypothetical protein
MPSSLNESVAEYFKKSEPRAVSFGLPDYRQLRRFVKACHEKR